MRTQPEITTPLELKTGTVFRDGHKYIVDPDGWTEEFAEITAVEEGVELTEDHWKIIRFMRQSHADTGVMVDVRHVNKFLANEMGVTKNEARRYLFTLFPYGYVKQACKIAGMKQPRAWSTG